MNKHEATQTSGRGHLHGPGWWKDHILYDEHYWWGEWVIFWMALLATVLIIASQV